MRILVPRGAEARAVRRAVANAAVVSPGAASAASLPAFAGGEPVVVLGLCGALRGLRAGDVVIYRSVAHDGGTTELDAHLVGVLGRRLPHARVVSACTVDHVVTRSDERAVLARRFDADVVDMEGAYLAAALAARCAGFAMVRVVSDDATRDLPPIDDAIDSAGRVRLLRIALAFARAPRAAFAFVRDVRHALATLAEVARTLGAHTAP